MPAPPPNKASEAVLKALSSNGYEEFKYPKRQLFANRTALGGRQFATQIIAGRNIYDCDRKCDFLVVNRERFPDGIIIECKWQSSPGSVDEKYPFLIFNIVLTGVPSIILLDGGGYKRAAFTWLKEQVSRNGCLRGVWTVAEFEREVAEGFLG